MLYCSGICLNNIETDEHGLPLNGGPYINSWKDECWYKNGFLHREDGPAIISYNSKDDIEKFWCIDGRCSRLDGPAIIRGNGLEEWWIDGMEYTKEEYDKEILVRKMSGLKGE